MRLLVFLGGLLGIGCLLGGWLIACFYDSQAISAFSACMSAICAFVGLCTSCYAINHQIARDKPQLQTKVYSIPDKFPADNGERIVVVKVINAGIVPCYISNLCYFGKINKLHFGCARVIPAFPRKRPHENLRFYIRKDFPIELTPFRSIYFAIPARQLKQLKIVHLERFFIMLEDGEKIVTKRCSKIFESVMQSIK